MHSALSSLASCRRWAAVFAFAITLILGGPPGALRAAIELSGLADEEVYANAVTFTVQVEPGFVITAELDGQPAPVGSPVTVPDADYHELFLAKTESATNASETRLVRFIVRDSARGNSEWGLRPWVPIPFVPSTGGEFAAAAPTVDLVVPATFPAGRQVPIGVRLAGGGDAATVRLNGILTFAEFPGARVEIRRGWGAGMLPVFAPGSGESDLHAAAGGLAADPRPLTIVDAPDWTQAGPDITVGTTWGPDAFVRVAEDLTIAAGATLTIAEGTVVEVGAGVDIEIDGGLVIQGTRERPVVFMGPPDGSPWGGCFARGAASRVDAAGTIFAGSGADDDWFSGSGYSAHRSEQATFLFSDDTTGTFTDCVFLGEAGQALHGRDATVTLRRCLVQGGPTTGQFNGGAVSVIDSALIGFPTADGEFADDDNDGIYFTGGTHRLTDSLVGWLRDDGVDAGSGGAGTVIIERCWFEATFHEAMAWSGAGRMATVTDTVVLNCGQGIEAGWTTGGSVSDSTPETPDVRATGCLVLSGGTGLRFGDNYDWGFNGLLDVQDSIVLHNTRNVFGRDWTSWQENLDRMNIRGNRLSEPDPLHPDNAIWDPGTDGPLLEPFMAAPGAPVGVAFAVWTTGRPLDSFGEPLPVGLSSFSSVPVGVDWLVIADGDPVSSGALMLPSGSTRADLTPDPSALPPGTRWAMVVLSGSTGGELTGTRAVAYMAADSDATDLVAVPEGATWRYSDAAIDLGTTWREHDFDDSGWPAGPAQLGFGDDDEATEVDGGPSSNRTPTIYFRRSFDLPADFDAASMTLRLLRDDGAVVHLNGLEIVRTNMPSGPVSFATHASGATSGEDDFRTFDLPPHALVPGTNLLAVEVHQSDATSSDLSFDLELAIREAGEPTLALAEAPDGTVFLIWGGEGWRPEWSDSLASDDWDAIGVEAPPLQLLPFEEVLPLGGTGARIAAKPRAFFRLNRGDAAPASNVRPAR